jgi:hypothetical protein
MSLRPGLSALAQIARADDAGRVAMARQAGTMVQVTGGRRLACREFGLAAATPLLYFQEPELSGLGRGAGSFAEAAGSFDPVAVRVPGQILD